MVLGVERLITDLRAIGQVVEGPFDSGKMRWLTVPTYPIPCGRLAGTVVKLGIAVPDDYPQTPPGGMYVSPKLITGPEAGPLHIHDNRAETADLPGEWQYWSRPIRDGWTGADGARCIVKHWNTVMLNV